MLGRVERHRHAAYRGEHRDDRHGGYRGDRR
jgi:hypothetical protein